MAKERREEERFTCPIGKFFKDLQKTSKGRSKAHEHLDRSGIEFLKAVRSLVDERIERLEKRAAGRQEKKATRIKVE